MKYAQVVELVDTPAWGAGPDYGVQVQVLSWALTTFYIEYIYLYDVRGRSKKEYQANGRCSP